MSPPGALAEAAGASLSPCALLRWVIRRRFLAGRASRAPGGRGDWAGRLFPTVFPEASGS